MTGKSEKPEDPEKTKKDGRAHLWSFDPSVFQPLPKASFLKRHLLGRLRSLGKYTLYSLAFSYPVVLVSLGIIFGGLVFWTALVGSIAFMWLLIKKAGYANNFSDWGVGNKRFLGLFGAAGLVIAFFYGLTHTRELFLPIFGGLLVITLVVGVRQFSKQ